MRRKVFLVKKTSPLFLWRDKIRGVGKERLHIIPIKENHYSSDFDSLISTGFLTLKKVFYHSFVFSLSVAEKDFWIESKYYLIKLVFLNENWML